MVTSRKSVPSTPFSPSDRARETALPGGEQPPASLYDLALELEPDLQSIALGSTTLRATMTSLVDLLLDHASPTMVWSKLPRGDNWQWELERYCRQSAQGQAAFNFYFPQQDSQPDIADAAMDLPMLRLGVPGLGQLSLTDGLGQDWLAARSPQPQNHNPAQSPDLAQALAQDPALRRPAPLVSIPLEQGGGFNGEYFLLVTSPQFQCLILARRFKRVEAELPEQGDRELDQPDVNPSQGHQSGAESAGGGRKNPVEKRFQLRMLYTCNPLVVSRILAQLKAVLAQVPTNSLAIRLGNGPKLGLHSSSNSGSNSGLNSSSNSGPNPNSNPGQPPGPSNTSGPAPGAHQASLAVAELLCHWNQLFLTPGTSSPEMELLTQWMMRQFQRQEALWRKLSAYRKQAEWGEQYHRSHGELLDRIHRQDEFLNLVIQELRKPLTNMKTALSLLTASQLKPPQRQRYLQLLNTECDRQTSLLSGLLNLNEIEQSEETPMQPLVLNEILPGIVSTYQPLAEEKEIPLTYSIAPGLPTVSCPLPWLRQIMSQLLDNSIKCTPSGGKVWVRAKRQGDYVQIEVQDTGLGIAQGEVANIFDRFYRVRGQGLEDPSGAGLGLTIVQQLLLRCGGSVAVNSRLGQGTTFSVLLPLWGDRQPQANC